MPRDHHSNNDCEFSDLRPYNTYGLQIPPETRGNATHSCSSSLEISDCVVLQGVEFYGDFCWGARGA